MRLRQDTAAASPLVVIATFVLGAVLVTAVAYALLFDRPEPALDLVEQRSDGTLSFEVASSAGGLAWADLHVLFLDRANTDQAEHFLTVPTGDVERGQAITVQPLPASGSYVLVVSYDGAELERLVVVL